MPRLKGGKSRGAWCWRRRKHWATGVDPVSATSDRTIVPSGCGGCAHVSPPVIRSRQLMRHHGGHALKSQDHRERLRASPRHAMECGRRRGGVVSSASARGITGRRVVSRRASIDFPTLEGPRRRRRLWAERLHQVHLHWRLGDEGQPRWSALIAGATGEINVRPAPPAAPSPASRYSQGPR
jgi:hypothetical protein